MIELQQRHIIFVIATVSVIMYLSKVVKLKKLLKIFLLLIPIIGIIKIPSIINSKYYVDETISNIPDSYKVFTWQLYSGSLEFQKFPNSIEIDRSVDKIFPERYLTKDIDFLDLWINELKNNPKGVMRTYIYKLIRVWTPVNNNKIDSTGLILNSFYAHIVFILFLLGIILSYKHEKNRYIFWIFIIPIIFLWSMHIFLLTESRYMNVGRIGQLYFAGFTISYMLKKISLNQISNIKI